MTRGEEIAEQIKREGAAEGRRRRKERKAVLEGLARLTYKERKQLLRKQGIRY